MAITVDTILSQLEEDLTKIATTNDYNTDPKIVRGVLTPPELGGNLPVVGFTLLTETFEMAFGGNDINTHLNIMFYGYAKMGKLDQVVQSGRTNADIHTLAHDVMKFLFTDDWVYSGNTVMSDNEIKYYEGGLQNPISVFVFEVKIQVDSSADTLNR